MYQVSVLNNNVETIIHYPTADTEVPHLNKLDLKEGLSMVDSLSFSLYPNNQGYDKVFELTTKVKVIDLRDNSIRFIGRVLSIDEKMDSGGVFCKEILCEGGLSYLNDTKTRSETFLGSTSDFISFLLNKHNAKVEDAKKIQVGNIDIIGSVAYTCDFKTTLADILAIKEKLGGDIRVRETNGFLYLDWLQSFSNNTIEVTLGLNMKEMIKHKDITSLGTRIIPLGANNLTIESINGGLDYIEDINAETVYGVLEKAVEYREITDPIELYNKALEDLPNHTQPLYLLESGALDLSFITGNKAEQFVLGDDLHIFNPIMAVDSVYKVVALDLDLLKPYDPKLTIANFPVKLTTAINDLRKSTVSNDGVYNGVQVGDSFGVRVASSDGKIVTTLNATEGISIENLIKNMKVFYVDTDGNIIHDGKHQTTSDGKLLIENWKNDNGGVVQIYDNSGNLNVKLGSENGLADNIGGTIVLLKDCPEGSNEDLFKRVALGILSATDEGIMQVLDTTGYPTVTIRAGNTSTGEGSQIRMIDTKGITEIKTDSITVGSETVATQSWVANYVATHMPIIPPPTT
ncbi:MAG: hypothetical protein E7211_08780 [Clostridium lundense]|nr:hypothetical protein [Clostridium lundense]